MLKAVIFDVDGVLVHSFEASLKFYQDLLSTAGYTPPTREQFMPVTAFTMVEVISHFLTSATEEEIQRIWKMGVDRVVPYPVDLITMPEYTSDVVTELSRHYKLGIVTNRIKSGVYRIPQLNQLKHCFNITVAYEDTTKHKPDPEPLLFALSNLDVKPEEAVYIGDTGSDVRAARGAGTHIISYPIRLENVDGYFASYAELPRVIQSLHDIITS